MNDFDIWKLDHQVFFRDEAGEVLLSDRQLLLRQVDAAHTDIPEAGFTSVVAGEDDYLYIVTPDGRRQRIGQVIIGDDTETAIVGLLKGDGETILQAVAGVDYAEASHTHGNITNTGAIGSTANLPLITTTGGVLTTGSFGSAANTFCQGNDTRLSNSREWTAATVTQADAEAGVATARVAFTVQRVWQAINSWWNGSAAKTKLDGIAPGATANSTDAFLLARANHTGTQAWSTITSTPTTLAGYGITDGQPLDSDLTAIAALTTDAFGRGLLTQPDAGSVRAYIGAGDNSFDGVYSSLSGIPATFTPSAHTHGNISNTGTIGGTANLPLITTTGGAVTTGSFGSAANTFCQGNDARLSDARAPLSHTHGNISNTGTIGSTANLPIITGVSGVLQAGSFGTAVNTFCQGNDARLSDARTPLAHTHNASDINAGTLAIARIPTGTTSSTVCIGNDPRLSDARPLLPISENTMLGNFTGSIVAPTPMPASAVRTFLSVYTSAEVDTALLGKANVSHFHGNIKNDGSIGVTANLPLITTTDGVITTGSFGSAANTFCQGNDARLSDARTPLAHVHAAGDITSGTLNIARIPTGTTSSTVCIGNDARLSDARTPTAHTHGNITDTGAIGGTANLPLITTTSGVITTGTFGAAANTFCQGNDSRLSDARTPLAHTHGNISNTGAIGSTASLPIITGASGVLQAGAFGTTAGTFCQGNDARLSDARTPLAHTHNASDINAGTLAIARIPTGTTSSTVCIGNDSRLSDARTPLAHTHTAADVTSGTFDAARIPNLDASKITSGTISIDRLPQAALERLVIVANQTARFALTTAQVQNGDTVKQTDTGFMYFVVDDTQLSSAAGYEIYTAGSASSVPWSGITDKPLVFPPEAHTHNASDINAGTLNIARIPTGTTSSTVCIGNDSRLSDARTPTAHTHGNITNAGAIGGTANLPLITTTSGVITTGAFGTTANTFCQGNDARLSDARTPLAHTHGNITNVGAIGSTANLPIITGASGVLQVGSFGTTANTFCQGNDARLSDARTPLAHVHDAGDVTTGSFNIARIPTGTTSSTVCIGNDSRLSDARTPTAHTHGNITNVGAIGATANLPLITTTSGVITTGSFGSAANTFCQGNDARLSDARTPLAHTHGNITNVGAIGATANLPIITGASGVLQAGSFGTAANTFCQGNDARLSDARTPLAHTHNASDINAGTLAGARLPNPTTTVLGGVKRNTGSAGQFVTGVSTAGDLEYATPPAGTVTSIATNNGITGGTITGAGTIGLTGNALSLHNLATNGIVARTAANTVTARTLAGGTGIDVTNGDGVSGNPSIALTSITSGAATVGALRYNGTTRAAGQLYGGTTAPESTTRLNYDGVFHVTELLALSKSFLIDHPTKAGVKLRHGSLEGPEHAVYVRGRSRCGIVELPEYWTSLVDPDSITVQLTAKGKKQDLYVEDIRDNKVYVAAENLPADELDFFYFIQAERVDVEKMEVEVV